MYGSICIGFSAAGSVASRSFAEFLKSPEFSVIGHDCLQILNEQSLLEGVVSPLFLRQNTMIFERIFPTIATYIYHFLMMN